MLLAHIVAFPRTGKAVYTSLKQMYGSSITLVRDTDTLEKIRSSSNLPIILVSTVSKIEKDFQLFPSYFYWWIDGEGHQDKTRAWFLEQKNDAGQILFEPKKEGQILAILKHALGQRPNPGECRDPGNPTSCL